MSYTVLARKYRPQTFTDLVGQEHVSRTLGNAIQGGRVAHAFLFTGARGVGKTTTARLLAKALNCSQGPTATPCNACDACREITAGNDIDVLEIDGASNNGVDDVRRLQESLPFRPARDRFKIVIVDEVHMLSTGAFNAFLKTLEEPPAHVKFVFATTEIHKVPVTIRSRCQRYDFRLIPHAVVAKRVREILATENIQADDAAISLVAREAAGSMRDALTVLDQVLALGGTDLHGDDVARGLAIASRDHVLGTTEALLSGDAAECLRRVAALAEQGLDMLHFARQLLECARDLVVLKVLGENDPPVALAPDELARAVALAGSQDRAELERTFAALTKLVEEVGQAGLPQMTLEMGLVQIAGRPALVPITDLIERLRTFEAQLGGNPGPGGAGPGGGARAPGGPARSSSSAAPSGSSASAVPSGPGIARADSGPSSSSAANPRTPAIARADSVPGNVADPRGLAIAGAEPASSSPPRTLRFEAPSASAPRTAVAAQIQAIDAAPARASTAPQTPDAARGTSGAATRDSTPARMPDSARAAAPQAPEAARTGAPNPTRGVVAAPAIGSARAGAATALDARGPLAAQALAAPPDPEPRTQTVPLAAPSGDPLALEDDQPPHPANSQAAPAAAPLPAAAPEPAPQPSAAKPLPLDASDWARIVNQVKTSQPALGAVLDHGMPLEVSATSLRIGFPDGSFFGRQAQSQAARASILRAAEHILGATPNLVFSNPGDTKLSTLAEIEETGKRARKAERVQAALSHPSVVDAMEVFGESEGSVDVHVEIE